MHTQHRGANGRERAGEAKPPRSAGFVLAKMRRLRRLGRDKPNAPPRFRRSGIRRGAPKPAGTRLKLENPARKPRIPSQSTHFCQQSAELPASAPLRATSTPPRTEEVLVPEEQARASRDFPSARNAKNQVRRQAARGLPFGKRQAQCRAQVAEEPARGKEEPLSQVAERQARTACDAPSAPSAKNQARRQAARACRLENGRPNAALRSSKGQREAQDSCVPPQVAEE